MISSNLNDSIRSLAQSGVEPEEIARSFGVDTEVVIAVLGARRATRTDKVKKRLEDMGEEATSVIQEILHDSEVHPLIRLKAATYVTDVATGIKAPAKNLLPDIPAGAATGGLFKQFMDTYMESCKRATEAPSTTGQEIINV